jgi:acyl carrier protein
MQTQSSSSTIEETKITLNPTEALQDWLVAQLSTQLSLEASTIKVSEPLTRYGLDSIDAVTLVGDLEEWLDLELPDTLFWDHPSIAQASAFLVENFEVENAIANLATETKVKAPAITEASTEKKGWGNLLGRFK